MLATQNPIEQEGTYPLPEAQLDRFLFKVFVGYPTPDEERQIYRLTTGMRHRSTSPRCWRATRFPQLQTLVRRVPVSDHCIDYAMALVRATRPGEPGGPAYVAQVDRLGRRPAGRAGADPGRQGPGGARRPHAASRSTTSAPSPSRCCGTGSSPTTTPRPQARRPTRSSTSLLDDVPVRPGAAQIDGQVAQVFRS